MKTHFILLWTFLGLFAGTSCLCAQSGDRNDDAENISAVKRTKQKGQFKANWRLPYPNPYRAAIYTLVVPGAGQIYNKRYWKAPIVWGGFAALFYAVDFNRRNRDEFETAYAQRLAGVDDIYKDVIRDAETLRRIRNSYDKNLQLSYIGFIGMYALSALDAYVDAHLKSFDMSDDLSLSIRPVFSSGDRSGTIGMGIFINMSHR
ncbi:MAG: hypothetical protein HKN76_04370 [Saprospiraceae bacterium]|nr:hypothetical protein [Saprospiraceae bacterium]